MGKYNYSVELGLQLASQTDGLHDTGNIQWLVQIEWTI